MLAQAYFTRESRASRLGSSRWMNAGNSRPNQDGPAPLFSMRDEISIWTSYMCSNDYVLSRSAVLAMPRSPQRLEPVR